MTFEEFMEELNRNAYVVRLRAEPLEWDSRLSSLDRSGRLIGKNVVLEGEFCTGQPGNAAWAKMQGSRLEGGLTENWDTQILLGMQYGDERHSVIKARQKLRLQAPEISMEVNGSPCASGRLEFIQPLEVTNNGTMKNWGTASLVFKNGLLVSASWL
ncbi:hypothetical protein [Ruminococcus gauvreauii]|uniref:Uncharacterized protein n=1 Tax=Ruminococcus gauvreauii TaxID=438033 RepID=A0ABY5VKD0_9FIRM|nr:hypothetical protein [Ruminococcus gauvreauii]UWP60426.1 hypothetical protein NQ502_05130 [Ruminococcus gauvreauii]